MLTGYLLISSSRKIQSRPQFVNTCQLFIESGYYVIVQFPVQSHPQHTIVQWEVHCGEEWILGSFYKRNERTVSNLSRETQTHKLVRGLVQAVWSSCFRADRDTPSLFCNVNNNMWTIYSIFRCWCHGDRITRLTLGVITRFRRSLWNDRKSVTSLEMNRLYSRDLVGCCGLPWRSLRKLPGSFCINSVTPVSSLYWRNPRTRAAPLFLTTSA